MKKEKKGQNLNFEKIIFAYALANAISHENKAKAEAVLPKLFQEGLEKKQIKEIMPLVKKAIKKINALSKEEQEKQFQEVSFLVKKREERIGLPLLPNAKGKVVMRFAPFPSGPLHLGNVKQAILNDEYCRQYRGKLFLVIDDTMGSEEKQILPEAYKLIPEALDWLCIKYAGPIIYKSSRLEIYYKYAEELIRKGKAYVCFCDAKTLRKNRAAGKECEHRNYSIEKNIEEWKKMPCTYKPGQATLRIKTDMKHANPAFRDRVLFRITEREHPRTCKKYRVWPMLEVSWAIDDHLLGITHILRGKDLMMESEMEKYIWEIFGWPKPEIIHTGLVQITEAKISKSKSQEEIISGKYFGWDDPRTWSIQSLRRRGFRPEAIRAFCLALGLAQTEARVPLEVLYTENKKFVETSNRYFFIADPVKIVIKSAPRLKAELPLHPNYHERGKRYFKTVQDFWFSKDDISKIVKGKIYRLMNLFNFIKNTYFEFHSQELKSELKAKLIHWLPADEKQTMACEVLMPNGSVIKGLAEKTAMNMKVNDVCQFERFGFCRLDEKSKDKVVFWFGHK